MFLKQQKSQTNSNSQQILLADPSFFLFLFFISIFFSPSLSDSCTPLLASLPVAVFLSFLSLSLSLTHTHALYSPSFFLFVAHNGVELNIALVD